MSRDIAFSYLRPDGATLRGRHLPGAGALLVFLSGFRSVHTGTKAEAVAAWAADNGHGCLRFDYLGHGRSDRRFEDFLVSEALSDTVAIIEKNRRPAQPLYLVGSSMGGWIALEAVRRGLLAPQGMLLIAPAVDFVSRRAAALPPEWAATLARRGHIQVPDHYAPGEHYTISQAFLDDALALEPGDQPMRLPCPTRIVHGTADDDVPIGTSRALAARMSNVRLTEVAGGDHRLTDHLPLLLGQLAALTQTP